MIRVTIKDRQETISFLASKDIARRLVAGCSANPGTVGELLLATEVFRQGIARAVMANLMAFDKALQRQGAEYARHIAGSQEVLEGDEPVHNAFQVVDAQTEAQAFSATDEGLIVLDVEARTVSATDNLQVPVAGEILAYSGNAVTDRAITYVLSKEWSVRAL